MRRIDWMEDEIQVSIEARDLMERLMCTDISARLGTQSAEEVKQHDWFKEVDWINLWDAPVQFIPTTKNIEDTDYFDDRGADQKAIEFEGAEQVNADFGENVYKNLPLLEKANQKIVSKIMSEYPTSEDWLRRRRDSLPHALPSSRRKSHMRTSSTGSDHSFSIANLVGKPPFQLPVTLSMDDSESEREVYSQRDVLIAEDNPITCQALSDLLGDLDCRCVTVSNGAEAVRSAMGTVKFDMIFTNFDTPIGTFY